MDDTEFPDEQALPNHLFISIKNEFRITRVVGSTVSPALVKTKVDISTVDQEADDYTERMDVALAKINYFLTEVVDGSIWISSANDWAVNSFVQGLGPRTSNSVAICPDEPTDALLCEIIMCKMKAISKGAFTIHSIEIDSSDSNGLGFIFVGGSPGEVFPDMKDWVGEFSYFTNPWWHRGDASVMDVIPEEGSDLNAPPSWAYSLGFIAEQMGGETDEKPQSEKVVRPEFRPKVIEGGKQDQ